MHGDGAALREAALALSTTKTLARIHGARTAVVGTSGQALDAAEGARPPTALAPVVTKPAVRTETVVAAIVLAAFLAIIVLVIWFRWVRPRRSG